MSYLFIYSSLVGLTIEEKYGGLNFGYVGLGQVLEECGRTHAASPLISSILLSATAIQLGGSQSQKENYLPNIASGSSILALAVDEGRHHNPSVCSTTLSKNLTVSGIKSWVLDGHIANTFVVAVLDENNSKILALVEANSEGVTIERIDMMDNRNMAKVTFENVPVVGLLENYNGSSPLITRVLDIGRIGISTEMLGGIQEAFERTMAYLKERKQFGVSIGSFQALQHRAAIMFGEIELCKSVVIKALKSIDENSDDISKFASLAKAKLGQTYKLVSNEAIQMFGGIGMTDDEEIGFFLKRARVAQQTLGDTNYHLDRLAKMNKY